MDAQLAQNALAMTLLALVDDGLARVELEYCEVGPVEQLILRATRIDGSTGSIADIDAAEEAVHAVREAMYTVDAGTWFSMTMTVRADGSMDAAYNYDEVPPSSFEFAPSAYAMDLERFPRSPARIPAWLRDRLE